MKLSKAIEGYKLASLANGLSHNTVSLYLYALKILTTHFDNPDLSTITEKLLQEHMVWLQTEYVPKRPDGNTDPLAASSLHVHWRALRAFFKWADTTLNIGRPDMVLSPPKHRNKPIIPLSQDDVKNLITACKHTKVAPNNGNAGYSYRRPTKERDIALILLLLDTGIRVSECARLKVGDIGLDNRELIIRAYGSGKKSRGRIVYIGDACRSSLWKYDAAKSNNEPKDYFFQTRSKSPMNRHNIRILLRRLGNKIQISNVHPHRFRHTFAIQFLRNGGNVFDLERLLGHSSLSMVHRYLALAETDTANAHRKASPVDRWII